MTDTHNDIHELKTDPAAFELSFTDRKPWEIRFNDRDYAAGDSLFLRETLFCGARMVEGAPLVYTGRVISAMVTHVFEGPRHGLAPGWCILSVEKQWQNDEHTVPELDILEDVLFDGEQQSESDDAMPTSLALVSLENFIKRAAQGHLGNINDSMGIREANEAMKIIGTKVPKAGSSKASELGTAERIRAEQALDFLREAVAAVEAITGADEEDDRDLADGLRLQAPPPGQAGQWKRFLDRLHVAWQGILDNDPGDSLAQDQCDEIEGALLAIRQGRSSGPLEW